jgi:hypothetical protein
MESFINFCNEHDLQVKYTFDESCYPVKRIIRVSGSINGEHHSYSINISDCELVKADLSLSFDEYIIKLITKEFGLCQESEKTAPINIDCEVIAVDFDGTLCENDWPGIGLPNYNLINYLKKKRQDGNVSLILWTCREKSLLTDAVLWCEERGLVFDAINVNAPEVIKAFGSDSRKIFAHEYIDDRSSTRFQLPYKY